jgi:hypothetical protein
VPSLPRGRQLVTLRDAADYIMPKGALPFDLLAFVTTIGQRYSMTQNEIIRLVMQEAEALGLNYRIGSGSR